MVWLQRPKNVGNIENIWSNSIIGDASKATGRVVELNRPELRTGPRRQSSDINRSLLTVMKSFTIYGFQRTEAIGRVY